MRVLLAGCGYVGTAAAQQLNATGHDTYGLRRSSSALPDWLRPIRADLLKPASLSAIPPSIDAVIYAVSPDRGDPDAYENAYVVGLTHCLEFFAQRGDPIRRVILTTSTGIYTENTGAWVDEDTPILSSTPTVHALLQAEKTLAAFPFEGVALRLGGIYGPGRTSLIDRVRSGSAQLPAEPRYTNRIQRDDAASAIVHTLFLDEAASVYNAVDTCPADMREVLQFLAKETGTALPPADAGSPPTGRRFRTHKRVSSRRLLRSGFRLRYPTYREGYATLLADDP